MSEKYEIYVWNSNKSKWRLVKQGRESMRIEEEESEYGVKFYMNAEPKFFGMLRIGTPNNTNSWDKGDYFETNRIVKVSEPVVKENGDVEIEFDTADFKYKWVDKNLQML